MKGIILLSSNENTKLIEDEEKARFVQGVLQEIGLPLNEIWDENGELSFDNKIKLRGILSTYQIQVIDSADGELIIYHEDKVIGEWKKCQYILKKDLNQRDPKKKLFYEMHIDNWSIFENNTE